MIKTNPSTSDVSASTKICVVVECSHTPQREFIVLEKMWWCNVLQLKVELEKLTGFGHKDLRLISTNYEMRNHDLLVDYIEPEIDKQAVVRRFLELHERKAVHIHVPEKQFRAFKEHLMEYEFVEAQMIAAGQLTKQLGVVRQLKDNNQPAMDKTIALVQSGFNKNINPDKTQFGVSGSYFLKDKMRNMVAIFKPMDEEPFAPNNYKDYRGKFGELSLRANIYSGGLCLREAAAYILDSKGVHGVPETTLVEIYHPAFKNFCSGAVGSYMQRGAYKSRFIEMIQEYGREEIKIGSLQRLVRKNGVACDISPSKFDEREVQKIALLDLRILNSDRNDENILYRRTAGDKYELTPIDHGLSLPATLEVYRHDLCWLGWKQVHAPVCPDLVAYVQKISPLDDIMLLKNKLDLSDCALRLLAVAEIFLKKAIASGLSLHDIAMMMYKDDEEEEKSVLERLVEQADYVYKRLARAVPKSWSMYPIIITRQKSFAERYLKASEQDKLFESIDKYDMQEDFGTRKRLYSADTNLEAFKDTPIRQRKSTVTARDVASHRVGMKRCLSAVDLSETEKSVHHVSHKATTLNPVFFYYFECHVDSFFAKNSSRTSVGTV